MVIRMLLLIFWATLGVAQTTGPGCVPAGNPDSQLELLRGRVKQVRTFKVWFRKDEQTGKMIRAKPEFEEEATYDTRGNQTNWHNPSYLPLDPNDKLIVDYDCDGPTRVKEMRYRRIKDSAFRRTVYKYDDKGRNVERANYFADGSLDRLEKYDYDAHGNIREEISKQQVHPEHFTPKRYDVYVTTKRTFEYDNKRNKTRETHYRPNGSQYAVWVFNYDSQNNLIKNTRTDNQGRLEDQFIYKYDRRGKLVEEKHYANFCYQRNGEMCRGTVNSGDGVFYYLTKTVYEYDGRGNWVRERQFSMGGESESKTFQPDHILFRRIVYYR